MFVYTNNKVKEVKDLVKSRKYLSIRDSIESCYLLTGAIPVPLTLDYIYYLPMERNDRL